MDSKSDNEPPLPPDVQSHFSWIRTRLSVMRTLEAWVRTAISLIGFGFTIVQFFERLDQSQWAAPPKIPNLARNMGLVLIGIGTVALAISIWQHRCLVKYLNGPAFSRISNVERVPRVPALIVVAVILCVVGLVTFLAILFRVI